MTPHVPWIPGWMSVPIRTETTFNKTTWALQVDTLHKCLENKLASRVEMKWPSRGWHLPIPEPQWRGSGGEWRAGIAGEVLMLLTPLTGGSGCLSGSAWGLLRWEYPEGDTWPVTARNLKKRSQTLQWCYSIFGTFVESRHSRFTYI